MSTPQKINLSSTSSIRSISDPNRPADLVLPPYQHDRRLAFDIAQQSPIPYTRQDTQNANVVSTIYKGRRADQITFDIGSAVRLSGNAEYAYPINSRETGELIYFTVSSNSADIVTQCFLYDKRDRATVLASHTTTQLTLLGRGMTYQEAHAVDNLGYSIDKHGTPHPVMPYTARHKHTFSKPFSLNDSDYDIVEGTVNDKYFVTDFAPAIPRAYERIYFNVVNKSSETRLLHAMTLNRFVFVDEYESVVNPTPQQLMGPEGITPGQVQTPTPARRAKVRRG